MVTVAGFKAFSGSVSLASTLKVPVASWFILKLSSLAVGFTLKCTVMESIQVPLVHINVYLPTALKFEISVWFEAGAAMVAVPGLAGSAVHVPTPMPAMVVPHTPNVVQLKYWSGPALMGTDAFTK